MQRTAQHQVPNYFLLFYSIAAYQINTILNTILLLS